MSRWSTVRRVLGWLLDAAAVITILHIASGTTGVMQLLSAQVGAW